jgi:hypothetical protein
VDRQNVVANRCGSLVAYLIGACLLFSATSAAGGSAGIQTAAADGLACSPLTLGVHLDLAYEASKARRERVVTAVRNVLSARIARNTLPWDRVEPNQGQPDWSVPDGVVRELTAVGVEPLLVITGSPSWANGVPTNIDMHQLYVPGDSGAFAAWLGRFAAFAHDAALRYSGKVHRWEVWNEPNLTSFWRPRPNAAEYAATYRMVRAAILAADPGARVAVGGLASLTVAWGEGNVSGLAFLEGIVARGVRPSLVAVHPYTTPPHAPDQEVRGQDNFNDIGLIHELLMRRGVRASIWVTEWGWSSHIVGLAGQANYVQRSLAMLRNDYRYVTVATYFIDHDRPPRFYEGLLDSSLRPKPAATRFAAFAASLANCKKRHRGSPR